VVLDSCLHDNGKLLDLRVAVVMPDHVHMIFTPLINTEAMEIYSLGEIMDAAKGASSHMINKILDRKGPVWQAESFDHVLRSSESLDAKIQYVLQNPVRRGLVTEWADYPWLWKKPFVNPYAPASNSLSFAQIHVGTAALGCPGEPSSPRLYAEGIPGLESLIKQPPKKTKPPRSSRSTLLTAELRSAGQPRAAVPTWFPFITRAPRTTPPQPASP